MTEMVVISMIFYAALLSLLAAIIVYGMPIELSEKNLYEDGSVKGVHRYRVFFTVLLLVFLGYGFTHMQSEDEVKLMRNSSGRLATVSKEQGAHLKWPWLEDIKYHTSEQAVCTEEADEQPSCPTVRVRLENGALYSVAFSVYYKLSSEEDFDYWKDVYNTFGGEKELVCELQGIPYAAYVADEMQSVEQENAQNVQTAERIAIDVGSAVSDDYGKGLVKLRIEVVKVDAIPSSQ